MSYAELNRYIADLRQSGFNTVELRVQLENKLAIPFITLVMAIIAVPFAVSMGKRGGLAARGRPRNARRLRARRWTCLVLALRR